MMRIIHGLAGVATGELTSGTTRTSMRLLAAAARFHCPAVSVSDGAG
jgi:hypothetical protein